jgi:hypothetical protein
MGPAAAIFSPTRACSDLAELPGVGEDLVLKIADIAAVDDLRHAIAAIRVHEIRWSERKLDEALGKPESPKQLRPTARQPAALAAAATKLAISTSS